ncbi:male-specific lethal 1-like 1 isoform X3 [Micropterus dolomieu]|uniref:male-specific lethal 1-like 1 isoform X3 n=1 Tax=Micropterus dolomieu TaxID=147949 RepID=UPI001E8E5730|nr:male-specific lethal 1-like 1 isoform X3 [Micropterus dolomieu]
MTLRATLFPNTGFKQDADTVDFDKTQHFGASAGSPVSLKKEPCDFVIDVQDVQRGEIPSKSKDLDQKYMTSKVSLAATVAGVVQGDNKTVGILSPVRQMGGEGTPVKGKPLSADNMENPQMAVNNNPKDAGADDSVKGLVPGVLGTASIELSSEGKWRNIRKTPANPHTQANCLRQILLLQLDLIEQQQQQLQSKDKEIDELKADKETLLARIERMERRLQLTRKDPPRDKRLFQPLEPWTPDKEDMWDLDVEESQQPNSATPLPFSRGGKGQKRKSCFGDAKVQKSRGKSAKLSPQKPEIQPGSPNQRELRIPSWRENHIEPLDEDSSFNPPEPLDDNVFLKRHAKLELDEKRRKRWDIQRIREQRMFQRLQQRMNRKKVVPETEPELSSFYPDTEDVETIVITPFLPVVAFGRPLPKLSQQNFELPWLDDRSRCRIEVPKKHTPHRTCRK